MSKLFDSKHLRKDTYTENGMPIHSSSGNWVVDLFFKMGASRKSTDGSLQYLLEKAWDENPELAIKAVFYNRDIRGGQGERRSFRVFIQWLAVNHLETLLKNLNLVPEYGRWDDLFVLFGINPALDENLLSLIWNRLRLGDKLLAKWMPREGKSKDTLAVMFMNRFGLAPKSYRKLLAGNTEVVETQMCQKQWGEIKYSAVPSVAMNKYRKAFSKQDPTRFTAWIQDVKSGKSKVNASAIFPHDIVRKVYYGDRDTDGAIQIQWDALPNYMTPGRRILPVCDVSGSMSGDPMLISISLGVYLAERNTGLFHNEFITFSGNPEFITLKNGAKLADKIQTIAHSHWGMNTDIERVFSTMLTRAVNANLAHEDMPNTILILSDMQFDSCVTGVNNTAMEMMRNKFNAAGYELPNIVFWNLRDSTGVPAKVDERGVALVSGFSPSIMLQVMGDDLSPMAVVLKTLMSERYSQVTL